MSEYAVIIERTKRGYAAWVPDLPGCVAVARTEKEIRSRAQAAVEIHLRGLRQERAAVPKPVTKVAFVADPKAGPLERVTEDVGRILSRAVRVGAKTAVGTARAVSQASRQAGRKE